jgi:hypothetical protein
MATPTPTQNRADEEVSRRREATLDMGVFPILVCKNERYWILDHFDRRILTRAEWLEIRERVDAFYDTYSDEAIEEYNDPVREMRAREAIQNRQEAKTVKPPKAGYIYLICGEETSWYKIGQSKSPKIRLKQLGTQGPFHCRLIHSFGVADMDGVESFLHEHFRSKRAQGEWFNLDAGDVEWFATFANEQQEANDGDE